MLLRNWQRVMPTNMGLNVFMCGLAGSIRTVLKHGARTDIDETTPIFAARLIQQKGDAVDISADHSKRIGTANFFIRCSSRVDDAVDVNVTKGFFNLFGLAKIERQPIHAANRLRGPASEGGENRLNPLIGLSNRFPANMARASSD